MSTTQFTERQRAMTGAITRAIHAEASKRGLSKDAVRKGCPHLTEDEFDVIWNGSGDIPAHHLILISEAITGTEEDWTSVAGAIGDAGIAALKRYRTEHTPA